LKANSFGKKEKKDVTKVGYSFSTTVWITPPLRV
jgi:hypothetical protein